MQVKEFGKLDSYLRYMGWLLCMIFYKLELSYNFVFGLISTFGKSERGLLGYNKVIVMICIIYCVVCIVMDV